jgi:hypothetical protein
VTFNVNRDGRGAPLPDGKGSLPRKGSRGRGLLAQEVTVEGTTLDDYFADHRFRRAALWIDVEGACGYVLPGGRDLLSRTAVVIVEVEDQEWWGRHHWLRERVVSYLYDFGLVPVARDLEYANQYNIVFVRAELLVGATRMRAALARFMSRADDLRRRPTLLGRVRDRAQVPS